MSEIQRRRRVQEGTPVESPIAFGKRMMSTLYGKFVEADVERARNWNQMAADLEVPYLEDPEAMTRMMDEVFRENVRKVMDRYDPRTGHPRR